MRRLTEFAAEVAAGWSDEVFGASDNAKLAERLANACKVTIPQGQEIAARERRRRGL